MAKQSVATLVALIYLCLFNSSVHAGETSSATLEPLNAITSLDIPRYLGSWYEIAKFPNWFQQKCVANTAAKYSLNNDGTLEVVNSCQLKNGATSVAIGQAKQIGLAHSPKLKVRFAPSWLSFIPLVWGDYWIIDLDDNYQIAAVSEPKREYLWILSRTPTVEPTLYAQLLIRLNAKGFNIQKLETTQQNKETK